MRKDDVGTEQVEHVIRILNGAASMSILKKQHMLTPRQVTRGTCLALHLVKRRSSELLLRADGRKPDRHLDATVRRTVPRPDDCL